MDSSRTECTNSGMCDDRHDCTVDTCNSMGVCRHEPIHERCMGGQLCSPTNGCQTGCTTAEDCNDGSVCNGREQCISGVCKGSADLGSIDVVDCNDGNECTIDACDEDRCDPEAPADTCCTVTNTCDTGVSLPDAATFDPATHYMGNFRILPGQSMDCVGASYDFSSGSFSASADALSLSGGPCTLTGARPANESFDLSCERSNCAVYRLTGSFSNADRFEGMWSVTTSGSCGICGSQNNAVAGTRQ